MVLNIRLLRSSQFHDSSHYAVLRTIITVLSFSKYAETYFASGAHQKTQTTSLVRYARSKDSSDIHPYGVLLKGTKSIHSQFYGFEELIGEKQKSVKL